MASDGLSTTFAALADPTRRAILARLATGPATVKELAEPFPISGPAISRHLRVLERAGLIESGRDAQRRPRRLAAAPLKEVAKFAAGYRRFWDASFDRLDVYLEQIKAEEAVMTTAGEVRRTVFTTPSDRKIVAVREVEAPREVVWAMWTDPRHVRQWMLGPEGWSMPVCEIDLCAGGRWRWVWRKDNGEEMEMHGVYRDVCPPERLVNTENWGGDWPETLNTLELSEQNGRTTMTSTVLYPSREARDAALATGMKDGWAQSYERLDEYLARTR